MIASRRQRVDHLQRQIHDAEKTIAQLQAGIALFEGIPADVPGSSATARDREVAALVVPCTRAHMLGVLGSSIQFSRQRIERMTKQLADAQKSLADDEAALAHK